MHTETNRSRSPEDIYFRTNRKRVCDFLLVRHSNLGPHILPRFRDIADFRTPPYFTQIWGCSRWTRSPMLWSARVKTYVVKLFSSIPTCVISVSERRRRTDGRLTVA